MLSLTPPIPKPTLLPKLRHHRRRCSRQLKPCCSSSFSKIPSTQLTPSSPSELYQPFRPPPSPLPDKYRSLDPGERLDILRNRLGLWHDYAPLISSLSHDGFPPTSIEDLTGISGIEQNRLSVASRVRETLASSSPDLLPSFDHTSATELLYEIRLLNAAQRSAVARYLVERNLYDAKPAQDIARAVKDFPRHRGDDGWDKFTGEFPADCLAYTHFRLSREVIATADKLAELEKALEIAETDEAKSRIGQEIERVSGEGEDAEEEESLVAAGGEAEVRGGGGGGVGGASAGVQGGGGEGRSEGGAGGVGGAVVLVMRPPKEGDDDD